MDGDAQEGTFSHMGAGRSHWGTRKGLRHTTPPLVGMLFQMEDADLAMWWWARGRPFANIKRMLSLLKSIYCHQYQWPPQAHRHMAHLASCI